MKYELFDLRNFNVLEDDQYYYVFRALNRADHEDIYNHLLATNTNPERIRTDRERYEAAHGKAKYTQDAEISLDEMYDHIKMHYIKETNCISLSSNSCVSLDYGGSYYDEYAVIRVPKNDSNANIHHAGQYMLYEVFISIEEALQNENIDPNIRKIIEVIDRCHSNQEIISIISELAKNSNYERNILSRFQSRQYFNDEQQLEYNKIIAKATILEVTGILPSIIRNNPDNQSLLASIGMAFSSGELIHYKDIPKEDFKLVSKRMMNLFSLTQQLKEKFPNNKDVYLLEERILDLYKRGYDIRSQDGKVVITNGTDTLETGLLELDTEIFNKTTMDPSVLSIEEIYNITGGSISYDKAKKAIEFCYTLANSRKEVYEYALVISTILGNNNLINEILNKCFIIDSKIVDRSNNNGYKVCESVNLGIDSKVTKSYTLEEQRKLIKIVLGLEINDIEDIVETRSIAFRNSILQNFDRGPAVSRNEYYATSIVDAIDFNKVYKETVSYEYLVEVKSKLSKLLSNSNISRLYNSFTNLQLSHEEISYYIFNLFIEKRLKGYSFDEICELENIDEFIVDNFSVLNRDINGLTLNNYLGIFNDSNYVPDSQICLRDFQQRIKNDVDRIYSNDKRFAGVVLPTGGGKSFIAMAEMMDRRDSKIIYIAPRIGILRNFKKNIVKYVAGLDPEGLADEELDVIVKDCFPHLELICYQSLKPSDEERFAQFKADFIILDEIHHIGGATWNRVVKKLMDNNPESQVLGISATPQRDEYIDFQGEEYFEMYGGDMMMAMAAYLDHYTYDELMQRPYLACDINIIDAIQEGYVICPNIISFDYSLDETDEYQKVLSLAAKIKDPITKKKVSDDVEEILSLVNTAKLSGVDSVISEHLQVKDGKYILFIPRKPSGYNGSTDEYIDEYIEEFKEMIADIDSEPHIDYIHSGRSESENLESMRRFEVDDSSHMKILVAIDMLNEGVHLPNINGSFNFRKIGSKHLILSLQHLGRVIYAIDPSKEYTQADIPVVFDKFNNYSNLDMDRLVNKKTVTSDFQKLKDAIFWIDKYGRYPNANSESQKEVKKAITLIRIREKYSKFIDSDLKEYHFSAYDKKNIQEIIELCNTYNVWSTDFGEISKERIRQIERVNLFNVTATQQTFLSLCNRIKEITGVSILKTSDRLQLLLKILDILAENDVILSTSKIHQECSLGEVLKEVGNYELELIRYELNKLGVGDNYPFGVEYYFGRNCLYNSKSIFNSYDYSLENITLLIKYGLLSNGRDFKIVDSKGFVITGPNHLFRKNIHTGTYYDQNGANIEGHDPFGFNIHNKRHKNTRTIYNENDFDIEHIHKVTKDIYDHHGFDINGIHKDTGTKYNPNGFDIYGNWYKKEGNEYKKYSYSKYDSNGYDIDGYNRRGFDKNGIHRITGEHYDEQFFGDDGLYWELAQNGVRRKTNRVYNDKNYDRKGNLYEFDPVTGKEINKGQVYNQYGFFPDGTHYKTRTKLDPDGYDVEGIWHRKTADGQYISTGSIFNDKGWTRDKLTLRHNAYGTTYTKTGEMFLDIVDDYGFDYRGRYHAPVDEFDNDGFKEFHSDVILYTEKIYHKNSVQGTYYDIHHFNQAGICSKTGTFLNEYGFDRNGYYWKKDKNGELYNTYSYFDDEGWTIDKKKYIKTKTGEVIYSSINERGFTIERFYKPYPSAPKKTYDDHGFDYYGINFSTGTHLDENNFDIDGYWWKEDENGQIVKTDSLYDNEGWSRNHTNIVTKTSRDIHGFNYLHLYRYPSSGKNREGRLSEYDPYGFDYRGIHRVTGKVYNKNQFDIDGFWYKKEGNEYVKTASKYDPTGYDINRRDKYGFTKNGYYLKTRKKYNDKGFMANGINIYTNQLYDLEGENIDGVLAGDVNWDLLSEINKRRSYESRRYIEDIIAECNWYEDLLDTYDEDTQGFLEYDGELDLFIAIVQATGIKENEELYTEEEILEHMRKDAIERRREAHQSEVDSFYMRYEFERLKNEGELSDSDIQDVYRLY